MKSWYEVTYQYAKNTFKQIVWKSVSSFKTPQFVQANLKGKVVCDMWINAVPFGLSTHFQCSIMKVIQSAVLKSSLSLCVSDLGDEFEASLLFSRDDAYPCTSVSILQVFGTLENRVQKWVTPSYQSLWRIWGLGPDFSSTLNKRVFRSQGYSWMAQCLDGKRY